MIKKFKGEELNDYRYKVDSGIDNSDDTINKKYMDGDIRIITEQSSYKLPQIVSMFRDHDKYDLNPDYQRGLSWNPEKQSRLIESFIMNIPIPPIFLYEVDYDRYEVMDGLQRLSTIISFYENKLKLTGLEEWPELEGRTYENLPEKIKNGIDRRQLMAITLLNETRGKDIDMIKKMIFERLNTGGVKLESQEIRNALFNGKFNDLCVKLTSTPSFLHLWNVSIENGESNENSSFKKMEDVELVLRFFAMRHYEVFNGVRLTDFLDNKLRSGNEYDDDLINKLEVTFVDVMDIIYKLFGEKGYCIYRQKKNNNYKWDQPSRMIYDPLNISIIENLESLQEVELDEFELENNIELLKQFYETNQEQFNGKKQSKSDIETRINLFNKLISDNFLNRI